MQTASMGQSQTKPSDAGNVGSVGGLNFESAPCSTWIRKLVLKITARGFQLRGTWWRGSLHLKLVPHSLEA